MALGVKNLPANAGDIKGGFNPWVRKISGGGHGSPLQYSCLENLMDRGAWQAAVHRVAKSSTQLNNLACMHVSYDRHTKLSFQEI